MENHKQASAVAEDYYDSDDAVRFYLDVWGGEDIHVGLYESETEAIREARRAVGDLGAVAVTVRPNPALGQRLDHPSREPFYAAVAELGVPLVVHESTGDPSTAGGERYGGMAVPESYTFNHVISHPFEQMMAMMALGDDDDDNWLGASLSYFC